ncbi:transglycosylase domain-containing protein [Dialister micraerophilus]|uniref:transglycosylase domain-containing protein n=1 Tax=Dialister micraerophilus TaxID=309120 RepID=UPI0023F3AA11|nr:biosynthetic peptidoglycan transglycosylase [Dialister micraerophilus]
MKKLLILITIIIAVYIGYEMGNDILDTQTVQTQSQTQTQTRKPESTDTISQIKNIFDNIKTKLEGNENTNENKKETAKAGKNESQTFFEKLNNIRNIKPAIEKYKQNENFVPSNEIPDLLKKGVVATEDRRFYEHGAIDIIGLTRALITNYKANRTLEGGSTISQQTAKNIFLSHERTITRKIEELFLAMQLEKSYTKDEILTLYLNTIYFGHGTYGIKDAAQTYFGKKPSELNLAECAMLAGLPQAPTAYDPINNPDDGKRRMMTVLTLMTQEGYITTEDALKAEKEFHVKKG